LRGWARTALHQRRAWFEIRHGFAGTLLNAVIDYNDSTKNEISMATLTIRNIDPAIKERLRVRAAQHGHSMEAELRRILQDTFREPEHPPAANLYQRIRARFAPLGGIDLELPPREQAPDPPRFD
jgi:plasmid stability protein